MLKKPLLRDNRPFIEWRSLASKGINVKISNKSNPKDLNHDIFTKYLRHKNFLHHLPTFILH